ncbi:lactoylglutathione lyase [Coralloluteibacterium thermophilus]|uniref:lactoylglutathione lyase n=1 Tax=Coralloluteibacterium thermophilum TaxID=2707049 RepID=A0ABV9NHQ1_9GAMM
MPHIATPPGVHPTREPATQGFVFNHVMLRVADIRASLDFYTRVLGFSLVDERHFEEAKFSLYFLAILDEGETIPEDPAERRDWLARQKSVLELTHNHGSETDGTVYHDGNSEPRGFGHLAIAVPDIHAACARFEELGVPFQKRLTDGRMKSIAFIKDPDGYWVEIIQLTKVA